MSDQGNQDQEIDFNDPKIQAYLEEQTKGLKTKNSELLGKFGELKEFKSKFDGVDVETLLQFAEKAKQDDITKKLSEGKFDEVLAQKTELMRSDYEQKLSEQTSRAQTLESKVLGGFIATYAAQAGVQPEAIDLVNMLAQNQFKLDANGDPVAVNAQGEVINGKDGKTPLSITDWLTSLRESKPLLWGNPQGSNAPGSKGGGKVDILKADGSVNLTKLGQLRNENPQLAKQLAAEHGIQLN
ncbi:hypothetical protein HLH10_04840 [Acinetobacter sp. ANC 4277]|uniref:hypothetical protein n=1 Tax=Acinetobacter terrae TaxID=2731247 RepID=UPI00149036A9|nr:hypothetical protein [Acinetobacter terrae]NNG75660.1 hypothetical protein [Acinetobacter terrae]